MSKERIIEISSWVITAVLLLVLVPLSRIREALVIFFVKQTITWYFGVLVVQQGLIQYPVRFFSKATNTSFTFEFFVYPSICVLFNLYFPFAKSYLWQIVYYVGFATSLTVLEVSLEKHTQLIQYIKWSWFWTWITLLITFAMSNAFYRWFFFK